MVKKFRTNFTDLRPPTPERKSGPSRVDTIGYQPFKKRIELMMQVSANVQSLQADAYEYTDSTLPDDFSPHPILSEKLDKMHHAIPQSGIMQRGREAIRKLNEARKKAAGKPSEPPKTGVVETTPDVPKPSQA